jgi:hypothetical protein
VIYTGATVASEAKGLVLGGCGLRFTGYCIGAVHQDVTENSVPDSRWLILSDERGLIPSGHTVGSIPVDIKPTTCNYGLAPPKKVTFTKALLDAKNKRVLVDATAPNAAMIGFALELADRHWQRVGWDTTPTGGQPESFGLPAPAAVGTKLLATACMGFRRPIGTPQELALRAGRSGSPTKTVATQPIDKDGSRVACNSGVLVSG